MSLWVVEKPCVIADRYRAVGVVLDADEAELGDLVETRCLAPAPADAVVTPVEVVAVSQAHLVMTPDGPQDPADIPPVATAPASGVAVVVNEPDAAPVDGEEPDDGAPATEPPAVEATESADAAVATAPQED